MIYKRNYKSCCHKQQSTIKVSRVETAIGYKNYLKNNQRQQLVIQIIKKLIRGNSQQLMLTKKN